MYTQENCTGCTGTLRYLNKYNIPYEVGHVAEIADTAAEHGFTSAPVVRWGDTWWSGYYPERLREVRDAQAA